MYSSFLTSNTNNTNILFAPFRDIADCWSDRLQVLQGESSHVWAPSPTLRTPSLPMTTMSTRQHGRHRLTATAMLSTSDSGWHRTDGRRALLTGWVTDTWQRQTTMMMRDDAMRQKCTRWRKRKLTTGECLGLTHFFGVNP